MKLVRPDERNQLAEQETEVDPVERQLGIGVNQLADVAAEGLGVDLLAANVERLEGAENAIGVLGDQPGQKIGDPLARRDVELPEHAVVERRDDTACEDAEVPRVGIGVEEAELEDLAKQDPGPGHGHLRGVGAQRSDPLEVIHADSVDELHRDHAGRGKGLDGVRNVCRGNAGKLALAPLHGVALDREVKLAFEAALELPGQCQGLVRSQEGKPPLGKLSQVLEDVEIGLHHLGDARAADLQSDGPAVAQDRAMNLGDRGRGHRLRIEREENLGQRRVVILRQNLFDLKEGKWPHVVAQRGELDGVGFGNDVGPGAEHLAEFDECRPELLADKPQPVRPILGCRVHTHRHPLDRPDDPFEMERGDHVMVAVPDQGRENLSVAGKVSKMANSFS